MNIGRPTLDKKDCTIKLRLNDEMRRWIEDRADTEGISLSEYVRSLISADMMYQKFSEKSKRET